MDNYLRFKAHAAEVFANYRANKDKLEIFRRNIIYRTNAEHTPSGGSVSDPTASAALEIITDPRMGEIYREIKAVEQVLSILPAEKKEFVRKVLISNRYTLAGLSELTGISDRTGKRWKKEACMILARQMGWID